MTSGTPSERMICAACGSTKKLNSAAGVTLPRSRAPPISTMRASLHASSGAWAKARAAGAAKHRNVGRPGELDEAQRVLGGEIDRHIAGDSGDAEEVETLGLGEGEQDGDGVVLAGIGIDDDLGARHGALLRGGKILPTPTLPRKGEGGSLMRVAARPSS